MCERILVAVDGSATAQRSLDEACRLARKLGSTLRVMHVVDHASPAANATGMDSYLSELAAPLTHAGEEILSAARARAAEHALPVETALRHCSSGHVADLIVKEVLAWHADLIVIGTHGRRGAGRLLLGNDVEHVVRSAPVPVMLVGDAVVHPLPR